MVYISVLSWEDVSVSVDLVCCWNLFQESVLCTIIQTKHSTCRCMGWNIEYQLLENALPVIVQQLPLSSDASRLSQQDKAPGTYLQKYFAGNCTMTWIANNNCVAN